MCLLPLKTRGSIKFRRYYGRTVMLPPLEKVREKRCHLNDSTKPHVAPKPESRLPEPTQEPPQ